MTTTNGGTVDPANQQQAGQAENDNVGDLNTQSENANQPQYITTEQLNRAITGHNKRMEQKFSTLLDQKFETIETLFSKFNNPEAPGEGQASQESQQQATSQPSKELLKLQRDFADLQKRLQNTEQEKENASKQALEERLKSQVLSTLTNLKVEKADQVYALVRNSLMVDESGNIKMKVVDPTLGFEDEKDLKSGLSDWLNAEGLHFLPPRPVTGSGASNQGRSTSNSRIPSYEELNKMKPSELAKVDLRKVFGDSEVAAFFNTNQ